MSGEQQLREQFEKWAAVRFPWLLESAPEFKPNGEYRFAPLRLRFEAWQGAFRARDAEVQALRAALREIAWLDTGENSSHSDALDALKKIEVIAFAALAGEEGTNHE